LDRLIIGGGPAGLLTAVYLGRYRRHVQVIDAGESRASILESHNYPGFFGIGVPELLVRLRAQAEQYGAQFTSGHVTSLRKEGEMFVASSQSGMWRQSSLCSPLAWSTIAHQSMALPLTVPLT
jgi:thioredoxin reductase (NADPH)